MKKISIITVNLNNQSGLERTARSVVEQTALGFVEWIIIDGGSNDESVDVIHKYKDDVAYWVSERDHGIYNAMNKGVAQAHGEYVLFLNSGDELAGKDVIEKFIYSDVYGRFDYCLGASNMIKDDRIEWVRRPDEEVSAFSLINNIAAHQSEFIKRERFSTIKYDETYKIAADMKLLFDDVVMRSASYVALNYVVSNFYMDGISSCLHSLRKDENERYLKELLPPRIYVDYVRWIQGDTILKKIIIKLSRKPISLFLLTIVAILVYFPTWLYNLFVYRVCGVFRRNLN